VIYLTICPESRVIYFLIPSKKPRTSPLKTTYVISASIRQLSVVFGNSRFQISARRMAFLTGACMIVLSPSRQIPAYTEIEL
jgi:hypothetical protein